MSTRTATKASKTFMHDPDAETMPREALTVLQTTRLKQTLELAYANVSHYRNKFAAAGVSPADFKLLSDIVRFPFTLKSDLRDNYPFGMFAVPREKLLRVHASSGTTGKPTVVGYTKRDLDTWADLMARCFASAGALPGDIVHNAYGYGLFTGGLGAHYGAERLGCTVVPASGGGTERQVTLINDFKANVLCATPSYALNIAEVAQKMGCDLKHSSLKVGLFGAEPWSDAMRHDVQDRLGLEAVLVGFPGLAPHYQIVLTREGALDAMRIEVELAPGVALDDAERAHKAEAVVHHIKSLIGVTCKVAVKAEGEVPRSQGKAVRVRDERSKTH